MAVDFGILARTPTIGARYAEGLQLAQADQERNMLRAAQMQQMRAQQENMLAQREDRKAQAALRGQQEAELKSRMERATREEGYLNKVSELFANNGMPLNLQTAQQGMAHALKSGDKNAIEMMGRTVTALQEREALRTAFGGQAAPAAAPSMMRQAPVAAAPAAPTNMFAGTMADIGTTQPAPVNALAAPPQAPAAPAAGGMSADRLRAIIADPASPKVVVDRAKAVLTSLPKPETPKVPSATSITEFNFARTPEGGGFKGTYTDFLASKQPKPAQLSVKLPEQEREFEKALGGGQAKKLLEDKVAAEDAASIISTVQQGRQLLQGGMITGFGADALTQIGAALNQAGFNFAEDAVANTQAFTANMAQNVGRIIKQFGAGTGLSNADRDYAEKMAGGKVTLDRKAIERILDINERAARNVISLHNKRAASVKTNVPLTVEAPASAALGRGGPPPAAVQYLRDNPGMKGEFDKKYGAGAADRALGSQ